MLLFQFGLFGSGGLDPTALTPASILELAIRVINIALALIGGIAVVYIVIAGLQYILAGGSDAKQAEAKKAIQAAIIGLLIVIFSFTLTSVLLRTLGFDDTIERENPNLREVIK